MTKEVSRSRYIAHYNALIRAEQKKAIDEFNTAGHFQMQDLINNIKAFKKKVNFARSGIQKEFFI